jgi:hypothetical protein
MNIAMTILAAASFVTPHRSSSGLPPEVKRASKHLFASVAAIINYQPAGC